MKLRTTPLTLGILGIAAGITAVSMAITIQRAEHVSLVDYAFAGVVFVVPHVLMGVFALALRHRSTAPGSCLRSAIVLSAGSPVIYVMVSGDHADAQAGMGAVFIALLQWVFLILSMSVIAFSSREGRDLRRSRDRGGRSRSPS